eukprot:TRINITY_DN35815_c0_g1_i1.p1 TRINITY_DN35815_c0_g1~~TRINITY_DN35815_c0_g1_i1.p1  ORF type:complete len:177 (+),score=33.50 TRINITY_DN35815_c0_g1_i1:68-532(+)
MAEESKVMKGATVKDVPCQAFIKALAAHFKKKMDLPEWHDLIKTATYKELSPIDPDWYFIRAASVARRVYLHGGIGVGALQIAYGGRNTNGVQRPHFSKAAKGVIRHALQQLEKLKFVGQRDGRKGRWMTKAGQRELDVIATELARAGTKAGSL